jgi:hypothetical protein
MRSASCQCTVSLIVHVSSSMGHNGTLKDSSIVSPAIHEEIAECPWGRTIYAPHILLLTHTHIAQTMYSGNHLSNFKCPLTISHSNYYNSLSTSYSTAITVIEEGTLADHWWLTHTHTYTSVSVSTCDIHGYIYCVKIVQAVGSNHGGDCFVVVTARAEGS